MMAIVLLRFFSIVFTSITLLLCLFFSLKKIKGAWSFVLPLLTIISIVGLAYTAIFDRNYYLRFLNKTVFPTGLIFQGSGPNSKKKVSLQYDLEADGLAPGTKVIYWASFSGDYDTPVKAYKDMSNSGYTEVQSGSTEFMLHEMPGTYKVPWKGKLQPHIHYRTVLKPSMLDEVKTIYLDKMF